jgi:hypothetical protein
MGAQTKHGHQLYAHPLVPRGRCPLAIVVFFHTHVKLVVIIIILILVLWYVCTVSSARTRTCARARARARVRARAQAVECCSKYAYFVCTLSPCLLTSSLVVLSYQLRWCEPPAIFKFHVHRDTSPTHLCVEASQA